MSIQTESLPIFEAELPTVPSVEVGAIAVRPLVSKLAEARESAAARDQGYGIPATMRESTLVSTDDRPELKWQASESPHPRIQEMQKSNRERVAEAQIRWSQVKRK